MPKGAPIGGKGGRTWAASLAKPVLDHDERWRNYRCSPPNRTGIGRLIALAIALAPRRSGGPPYGREAVDTGRDK